MGHVKGVCLAAMAVSLALTGGAMAQGAKPSPVQDVKSLTGTAARAMVDGCLAFAQKNNMKVTIIVVDAHGDTLDFHRMEGSRANTYRTAPAKAKSALINGVSTRELGDRVAQGNQTAVWLGDFPSRGGLPVIVNGAVVGAIGVGGGQNDQDEDCGKAGIAAAIQ